MRLPILLLPATALVVLAGCAGTGASHALLSRQIVENDSLRRVQAHLWEQVGLLTDSLRFCDDIDTGQYYRDRRELEGRLQRQEYDLALWRDAGLTLATLPVDELFRAATAELTEGGQRRLDAVAARLDSVGARGRLRVEGHSDTVPVGASLKERYPTNWELSAARAAAVGRYLMNEHDWKPERLEVVSLAGAYPVASNETDAGRRANRRIRLAMLPY